jgi:putative glutamine amidotransferase
MSKSVIGILANLRGSDADLSVRCKNVIVRNAYVLSVLNSGGIPLILPPIGDDEVISGMIGKIDGLLVTGGNDLQTQLFGEEPERNQGSFSPERDEMDLKSIRETYRQHKPILGICRGIQAINVCFGGTLYQDLDPKKFPVKHDQDSETCYGSHMVAVQENSMLFPLMGEKFLVNSFHHQAVKRAADGFQVTALSLDGVVEAIENKGEDFILGVQWHPELMAAAGNAEMQKIFDLFLNACK